jgi:hypothetical protein
MGKPRWAERIEGIGCGASGAVADGGAVAAHGAAIGAEVDAEAPQRAEVDGTTRAHEGGFAATGAEVSLAAGAEGTHALAFDGFVGVVDIGVHKG